MHNAPNQSWPKESWDNREIQTILERLGKLERQNRRLKYTGLAALTAFGLLAIVGGTTYKRRMVRAEEFQLVDSRGNLIGRMRADGHNPELELYNQHGISAVSLYAYDNGNTGQLRLSSVDSGATTKTSADSIEMTMPDGKILWRAPLESNVPHGLSK